ncbi:Gfo/Idh/MocA family oxidoreductase [Flavobacterium aquidurense]|uniref:Gfo/Idh/MocA family protein n=1 Tax=Flavobacterium aquidurense TaxID=362413 RepID=UPI0028642497|nr:Gfo/Idh/MocA family oxidoreductase [Flavobacterium aquidurense]MDR7370986.1 putative dehydrogenase [Flavobacterium aquidurense]
MKIDNKIKWGIVGLGNIAHQFATDLLLIEDASLAAVASRNFDKANDFAAEYNCPKAYDSYEAIFADKDVEIIYIATPHDSHADLSIKALENGKHVLCEKPLALSFEDAVRMIEASKKYNKFFMEAFWTRFLPAFQEIFAKVKNGEIGELTYLNADFTFCADLSGLNRLTDVKRGGGALFDIGVYPIFISYIMLGMPKEIIAKAKYHDTGVDVQTSIVLQYENAQAVLHTDLVSSPSMKANICGTKGRAELNAPWFMSDGYSIIKDDREEKFILPNLGKGYSHEAIECHKCIRNNQIESQLWSHQNSLDLSEIVNKIKKQIGLPF